MFVVLTEVASPLHASGLSVVMSRNHRYLLIVTNHGQNLNSLCEALII